MKKIIISICFVLAFLTVLSGCKGKTADLDVLYESAVRDAAFAEAEVTVEFTDTTAEFIERLTK